MSNPSAVTVPATGSELAEAIKCVLQDTLDEYAPGYPPPRVCDLIETLEETLKAHGYHYESPFSKLPWGGR